MDGVFNGNVIWHLVVFGEKQKVIDFALYGRGQ